MSSNASVSVKEPFIRLKRRTDLRWYQSWLIRIIAVLLALVVNAIFINSLTGISPLEVYKVMWSGTFESGFKFMTTLRDTMVLLCVGLALVPAFSMRFWNIGGEGQVLMGALASILLMIYASGLPNALLLLLMFLSSAVFGALWAFIPAYFKAKWNTNETLFTLMMNYVAINIVNALTNIWRGSKSAMGTINSHTRKGWFPKVLGYRFMPFILIVVAMAVFITIYMRYSKHGYEISVLGDSPNTARYAGIKTKKVIIRTMILSGALCGIAGFGIVSGIDMTISSSTARGFGFTAIIKGASQITSAYSVLNDYASQVITGIILFFILGSEFFVRYKIIFRGHHAVTAAAAAAASGTSSASKNEPARKDGDK